LGFIVLMSLRLAFQEMFNNQAIGRKLFGSLMFLISGGLLLALAIYQTYVVANNSSSFYYDASTKTGN
jgi:hypothetical protein